MPEALHALDRAKNADPANLEPYLLRSQLLEQAGNLRGAREEALAAHRRKPGDATAAVRALYVSADFSAPSEVEALAREAKQLAPDNPDAHLFLANAIVRSEEKARFAEAIKEYDAANRLAPFAAAPLLGMGRLLLRMGDADRAAAYLRNAVRLLAQVPRGPMSIPQITQWVEERRTAAFALAQAYSRLGRHAESRTINEEAALWSRRASELRALKNRYSAVPPDPLAHQRLSLLASRGPLDWPD
jgi:tetratricopeptide (TPR) repeat protein